jgi:hypothetical protein
MPEGPQGQKPRPNPIRTYALLVLGISALAGSIVGPRIQAWYQTMPPEHGKAIGAVLFFGFVVIVGVGALFAISRSSDA